MWVSVSLISLLLFLVLPQEKVNVLSVVEGGRDEGEGTSVSGLIPIAWLMVVRGLLLLSAPVMMIAPLE